MARQLYLAAFAAVAVLLLTGAAVRADLTEEVQSQIKAAAAQARGHGHPLTNIPGPDPNVETKFLFTKHKGKKQLFPAGANVEVVVGFRNGAAVPYNISAIMGSLNSPLDFSIYVQNFTHQSYRLEVAPNNEATVVYNFRPDPALHPREFTVALTCFYANTQGGMMATTFFNQTIEIVEAPRTIDAEILFLWALLIGSVGFASFKAYSFAGKFLGGKKAGKGKKAAAADHSDDDYLAGTAFAAEKKKAEKRAAKSTTKGE